MDFIQHSTCNFALGAPRDVPIEVCRALPVNRFVEDGLQSFQSFWVPSPEELQALNVGHPIMLTITGPHPMVRLEVAAVKT